MISKQNVASSVGHSSHRTRIENSTALQVRTRAWCRKDVMPGDDSPVEAPLAVALGYGEVLLQLCLVFVAPRRHYHPCILFGINTKAQLAQDEWLKVVTHEMPKTTLQAEIAAS